METTYDKIGQETKSEIQELFDELFVKSLVESAKGISEQCKESKELLCGIKKQSIINNNELYDRIQKVEQHLKCIGEEDDWGEYTLISFLNQLARRIYSCKEEVDFQLKILGDAWGEDTIHTALNNLELQITDLQDSMGTSKQNTIELGFERLYNELKQINGIIGKLTIIESQQNRTIQIIEEFLKLVHNEKENFVEKINSIELRITEVNEEQKLLRSDALLCQQNGYENVEELKSIIYELNQEYQKKTKIFLYGIGSAFLLNIIILVILILK